MNIFSLRNSDLQHLDENLPNFPGYFQENFNKIKWVEEKLSIKSNWYYFANHKKHWQSYEPIRTRRKYKQPTLRAGKYLLVNHNGFLPLIGWECGARCYVNHKRGQGKTGLVEKKNERYLVRLKKAVLKRICFTSDPHSPSSLVFQNSKSQCKTMNLKKKQYSATALLGFLMASL